ncbi:MAG TPA: hypothetical protein PKM41_14065 [Deltaproteobacteria bacterium]|jgi:hypothetical protein|nr:hypothetical protein [Deltaproteobacteria bacterium]HOI08353.1 hypothetical protein [Deltaproteobacteria bacterium]
MNWSTYLLAVLAALSLGSILIGRPWTVIVARRHTPPEVWSTGLFLETNMIITGAWVLLFALGAVLSATMPLWVNLLVAVLYPVLGRFSSRFGLWYSSKRLESMLGGKDRP